MPHETATAFFFVLFRAVLSSFCPSHRVVLSSLWDWFQKNIDNLLLLRPLSPVQPVARSVCNDFISFPS